MAQNASNKMLGPLARRLEIEAKFAIADDRIFERLRAQDAIGEYALTPCGEQDVVDLYLDTAGRDLRKAGWGCRLREGIHPGRTLVTLKSLGHARGAVHRRQEHELEIVSGLAPGAWPPGPVRETIDELAHGHALLPLLTLRQHRTLHDVRRGARVVAVRFLDRVEMQSGHRRRTTLELELELTAEGTLADLQDLEHSMRRFRLQPHTKSKLERALEWIEHGDEDVVVAESAAETTAAAADTTPKRPATSTDNARPARVRRARTAAPAERPVIEPVGTNEPSVVPAKPSKKKRKGPAVHGGESFAEAGRKILAYHYERMLQHEDGTRAGTDPEELHDMRVATRRQRAALRIVLPHFRRKAVRPMRDGLRAVATALGAVRDLDVMLEAAVSYQRSLEPDEASALRALLDAWTARRDVARNDMLAHLDSDAWAAFKREYRTFLDTPGAGVAPSASGEVPRPQLVAEVLPAEVWQHYGAIRAYESVLPWAAVETLHALRIECKRLRYVLEFFVEALDPEAEHAIGALVALQDQLGLLNDSHVTVGLVREFLAGSHALGRGDAMIAAGRYLEFHRDKMQELRRGVDAPWRRVMSAECKQVLARAVAVL